MFTQDDFLSFVDVSTSEEIRLPINPTVIDWGNIESNEYSVLDGYPKCICTIPDYIIGEFFFLSVPERYSSIIDIFRDTLKDREVKVVLDYGDYISKVVGEEDVIIVVKAVSVTYSYQGLPKFNMEVKFLREAFDHEKFII